MATSKKVGILVVAYNAVTTLAQVLDRIPQNFRSSIAEVIVSDDYSQDSTYLVGLGYQQLSDMPITMIRQPRNLGYGGNQKAGYDLAIEHGLDVVVMLHGDGQYAPELLPEMVAPLLEGNADAVFGSRMLVPGAARRGGMPLYKFWGNRVLSRFENAALGTELSEFHSGYRAYSVDALRQISYHKNSDGFNFDTQIIIQLHDLKKRIVEIPIPTYYGDEVCYVNGLAYAADVTKDVLSYRLASIGFGGGQRVTVADEYKLKDDTDSSHSRIFAQLASRRPGDILDLGCSGGVLGERLREVGHRVTGVDFVEIPKVRDRVDHFVQADLNHGIPNEASGQYDVVLAADVLEHLTDPRRLLDDVHAVLKTEGTALVCVPNISHWYPRFRTLLGLFDYDQRGILDRTHLRFFTRRSIIHLAEDAGFSVRRVEAVGLPLGSLGMNGSLGKFGSVLDRVLLHLWPTLFGYQFILELASRARSEHPRQGHRLTAAPRDEEPDGLMQPHTPSPADDLKLEA